MDPFSPARVPLLLGVITSDFPYLALPPWLRSEESLPSTVEGGGKMEPNNPVEDDEETGEGSLGPKR
jgi:hypothetical protein